MSIPDVIVVGAATRDLTDLDPRGWFMGGGVTFSSLTLARLGLRVGVILGLDAEARGAREVEHLHRAGAEVIEVPIEKGPIFINDESGPYRVQTCMSTSSRLPVDALPADWRATKAWMMTPIASEIGEEWMDVPAPDACVGFAWQGELRVLADGAVVRPRDPEPSAFLARADLTGLSRFDIPHSFDLRTMAGWLKDEADVLLTAGMHGGLLLNYRDGRIAGGRLYPSVPSKQEVDPVGAGDTMLAGAMAARIVGGSAARVRGHDLHVGAATSSCLVEGPGIDSVPDLGQLRQRLRGS